MSRYELSPDKVDCVVFCSKNYTPILPHLHEITDRFPAYFHYTITAYGKDIEPGVPPIEKSMETLIRLSEQVGRERIAWRYDPVLLTDQYTIQTHLKTFERMTGILETNMPELILLTEQDKETLAKGMGEIARSHGMPIQTCGTNGDYTRYGICQSECMTLDILGKANGIEFKNLKHKGMRQGCHCMESRDIGAYDTCLNGCKYCYANKNPRKAFENYKYHNPDSPLLLGELKDTNTILQGMQKSFRKG